MQHSQPKAGDDNYISLADFFADASNHQPRPHPGASSSGKRGLPRFAAEPADDNAPSVIDPVIGAVRVMSSRCGTCIGRAGNPANLSAERFNELLGRRRDGTYDEGHTVCHSTLPGNEYGLPPAVCAWIAQHPTPLPERWHCAWRHTPGLATWARPAAGPSPGPSPTTDARRWGGPPHCAPKPKPLTPPSSNDLARDRGPGAGRAFGAN